MERQNSITLKGITNFLESGALLRHKNRWIVIEGPFEPQLHPDSVEISVFCPDFYDLGAPALWRGHKQHTLHVGELQQLCESFLAQTADLQGSLEKGSWQEPAQKDFVEALTQIQARITRGEIQKAVPVVFTRAQQKTGARERAKMLLKLLSAPDSLYVYGFWNSEGGLLGATPEVLFDYSSGLLKTMALAGTCPKSERAERDSLLQDEKEMQEHRLVVEDLTQMLSSWGEVQAQGPYILELPALYHLKTDLEVHCPSMPDFVELSRKLHPTPALGVAPRSAGYHWMLALPGQQGRGRFGAPLGFFSSEEALCLVAIRNLQWNKDSAMIGSGCGIVAASELEREWRELYQKRLSVKKILGLEV